MQGGDQQAYDRGTSLFSPDGRIYQVEYAREAVNRGAASVGVRTAEGVVLAAQTRARSSLMEAQSIEKLHKIDDHVGTASAGHVADARRLIDFARRQAQVNRLRYGEPMGIETLTKTVTDHIQQYTQVGGARPFGVALIIGGVETLAKDITDHIQQSTQVGGTRPYGAALLIAGVEDGRPRLFETDPSGTPHEWRAVAIGGSHDAIQSFLEEEYEEGMDLDTGVDLALRALLVGTDDLEAGEISLATIDGDGYEEYTTDEIAAAFPETDADDESDA